MKISFQTWRKWTFLWAILLVNMSISTSANAITGAGATFPYPLYSKWAEKYRAHSGGVELNYQSIGSGGGIKQIIAKTVDFGASDKPLRVEEKDAKKESLTKHGLIQFPTIIGGVVLVYNLPKIPSGALKLTPKIISDIFLGQITKWNDPAIKKQNPDLDLPDLAITSVHRSDGSGTTYLFTSYLSQMNEDWAKKVGSESAVAWPAGIGSKGNEGVAATVLSTSGTLGYVEYSYAKPNNLSYAQLETAPGVFVEPSIDSFQAAALYTQWDSKDGFYSTMTVPKGSEGWPITGASYIIVQQKVDDDRKANVLETLKFFSWAFTPEGKKIATELSYVPLPDSLIKKIKDSWGQIKDAQGQPLWADDQQKAVSK